MTIRRSRAVDEVECVVVGAGVVGLATARALALAGLEVLVLERAYTIGFETSSRNSEVIHAGLYYPAGSLKALLCRRAKAPLLLLSRARGSSCPNRQADRRHRASRTRGSRANCQRRPGKRCQRSPVAQRPTGATARTSVALRRRLALALYRNRRQSRTDARPSRPSGGRWCNGRAANSVAVGPGAR